MKTLDFCYKIWYNIFVNKGYKDIWRYWIMKNVVKMLETQGFEKLEKVANNIYISTIKDNGASVNLQNKNTSQGFMTSIKDCVKS